MLLSTRLTFSRPHKFKKSPSSLEPASFPNDLPTPIMAVLCCQELIYVCVIIGNYLRGSRSGRVDRSSLDRTDRDHVGSVILRVLPLHIARLLPTFLSSHTPTKRFRRPLSALLGTWHSPTIAALLMFLLYLPSMKWGRYFGFMHRRRLLLPPPLPLLLSLVKVITQEPLILSH